MKWDVTLLTPSYVDISFQGVICSAVSGQHKFCKEQFNALRLSWLIRFVLRRKCLKIWLKSSPSELTLHFNSNQKKVQTGLISIMSKPDNIFSFLLLPGVKKSREFLLKYSLDFTKKKSPCLPYFTRGVGAFGQIGQHFFEHLYMLTNFFHFFKAILTIWKGDILDFGGSPKLNGGT